ncbi:MAG TPA: hypothetical protein VGN14_01450 [Candidatus Elarobacter sp.]
MTPPPPQTDPDEPGMIRREITLPDGRLLIFYSFDDGAGDE